MPNTTIKPVFLCVANWDSNVGYAWWLMESFWIKIESELNTTHQVIIAYPSISRLPPHIEQSPIGKMQFNFRLTSISDLQAHRQFIKSNNIKVLYFSDRPTSHWSYAALKIFCGIEKIIVHDHTPGQRTVATGLKRVLKKIWARIPFFSADAAIGATEYVKQRLITVNCFPAQYCYAAPNGLPPLDDSGTTSLNLRQMLQLPEQTVLIVSTGRVTFYKGVDFALALIARLVHQENIQNIHYVYCGDGPDIQAAKTLAESLDVTAHVTLLGRVDGVHQVLSQCNIAFHPSRGEVGYSLSILEYMRSGLPVVLSNNPSVCEAITHQKNGLIYNDGDLDNAIEQFKKLIFDEALRIELGKQGKKTVQEKYSLSNTHTALMHAIRATLTKKD